MTFYIQVSDGQFINEQFHSIQEARTFCVQHRIHGYQILDEYQLQQMREEVQESRNHPQSSIIKRANYGAERNVRIPVAHPRVSPNNVRQYEPIKPYFRPHKSYLGRRKKK